MAYPYEVKRMRDLLELLVRKSIKEEDFSALQKYHLRWEQEKKISDFNFTFTAIPRLVEKTIIHPDKKEADALTHIRKNFSVDGWALDRLVRCWWVLQLPSEDEAQYVQQIENMFKSAEMNEQVALYSTLPLMAWPESFRHRASEGIRTSMSVVYAAVALENPYPSEYLEEAAWNQMVLKAFFMGQPVNRIIGIEERANKKLAYILSDYAHERWAAFRPVDPLLWWPVSKFVDEQLFPDLQKLFSSENELEKKAAALACAESDYEPAKKLLDQHPELKNQVEKGKLSWESQNWLG